MNKFTLFFAILFFATRAVAQYDDPGLPGGDPDVPIDGGVIGLVVAATGFAIKKIRDARR